MKWKVLKTKIDKKIRKIVNQVKRLWFEMTCEMKFSVFCYTESETQWQYFVVFGGANPFGISIHHRKFHINCNFRFWDISTKSLSQAFSQYNSVIQIKYLWNNSIYGSNVPKIGNQLNYIIVIINRVIPIEVE